MERKAPQVLANKVLQCVYRITYRCARPNMDNTFTKDFQYIGTEPDILLAVKRELGHYGGLKAERIKEEKI
jgi:hypothetical protein